MNFSQFLCKEGKVATNLIFEGWRITNKLSLNNLVGYDMTIPFKVRNNVRTARKYGKTSEMTMKQYTVKKEPEEQQEQTDFLY